MLEDNQDISEDKKTPLKNKGSGKEARSRYYSVRCFVCFLTSCHVISYSKARLKLSNADSLCFVWVIDVLMYLY